MAGGSSSQTEAAGIGRPLMSNASPKFSVGCGWCIRFGSEPGGSATAGECECAGELGLKAKLSKT